METGLNDRQCPNFVIEEEPGQPLLSEKASGTPQENGTVMQRNFDPRDINIIQLSDNVMVDYTDVQKHRLHTLRDNLPMNHLNDTYCLTNRRIIYDKNRKFLYCHVAKIGSTYWMRVFNIIVMNLDYSNPFDIPRGLVHRDQIDDWKSEDINTSGWLKFLFVRNPFDRIFSSYIDKFVSPNIYYFFIATFIIQRHRLIPTIDSLRCGHDLSFEEFLKAVISREIPDEHWCPIYRVCDVTNISYSFVGKKETFSSDSKVVLNKIDRENKIKIPQNHSDTENDVITINIKRAFDFEAQRFYKGLNCSFLDVKYALQRVWKVLQLKAIIDHEQMFPFTLQKDSNLTTKTFVTVVRSAITNSFKRYTKSDLQKHVLYKAYSTLSRKTKDLFVQHFKYDFSMFEYHTSLDSPKHDIDWNPF